MSSVWMSQTERDKKTLWIEFETKGDRRKLRARQKKTVREIESVSLDVQMSNRRADVNPQQRHGWHRWRSTWISEWNTGYRAEIDALPIRCSMQLSWKRRTQQTSHPQETTTHKLSNDTLNCWADQSQSGRRRKAWWVIKTVGIWTRKPVRENRDRREQNHDVLNDDDDDEGLDDTVTGNDEWPVMTHNTRSGEDDALMLWFEVEMLLFFTLWLNTASFRLHVKTGSRILLAAVKTGN